MLKKAIAQFLILLMLLPAWVCAMPACDNNTPQQQAMTSMAHCDHAEHSQADQVMVIADCMHVDLQQAPSFQHLAQFHLDAQWPNTAVWYLRDLNLSLVRQLSIISVTPPKSTPLDLAVYLSTHRIRI